jgi:hypothetical protein
VFSFLFDKRVCAPRRKPRSKTALAKPASHGVQNENEAPVLDFCI